ncbi:MAG: hypothetical protein QF754_11085 [Alphaproteobacteria bacterium]|jgi:hypothetical protein|nr:hypothetical protein [Alphaproteobacteria bacterium]
MRIPGADKAVANIMKWSAKDDWRPYREQVFAQHFDIICDRFDITEEEITDFLGDSFGMYFGCVFEDFLATRFEEDGEKNVIDEYLKRRGWREKVPAKRYLEAIKNSVMSLHEVVDLNPGHTMTVRDLVLGGDPVTVEEKLGSETAVRWDRIAGRIVTVNKKNYFTGAMLLFSQEVSDEVLAGIDEMVKNIKKRLRREAKKVEEHVNFDDMDLRAMFLRSSAQLFTSTWLTDALDQSLAPMPEVRNSDGEELLFSEARFPISGEISEVIAGLGKIDEFDRDDLEELRWTWLGLGSPSARVADEEGLTVETDHASGRTVLGGIEIAKGALILSTNSTTRADQGQRLLLSRLEGLLGQPLTSHQTLESMLDEHPETPSIEDELPAEVAEQAIHSYLENHYRQTLDEPLPFLDDKTPRQAAKTKKGRTQVISWLKKLENSEARRAAGQGQEPYDFQWMWRELKIDDLS